MSIPLFSLVNFTEFFFKAMKSIPEATSQQDNVLLEYHLVYNTFFCLIIYRYECALIRNKLEKTPVIPVFLAEFDPNDPLKFVKFSRDTKFPDLPHKRNSSSKIFFDELWYFHSLWVNLLTNIVPTSSKTKSQVDLSFLNSISQTMKEVSD